MGCNMLEQSKGANVCQFRDDWVCAAIDGTWGNDDEACDNDDLHAVFLFGT